MFAPILHWVWGTGRRPIESFPEFFSGVPAKTRLGEELLSAVPRRRQMATEIEELLIGLPKAVRPELVGRTILRFALYVVDLPSSERNHDPGQYGLFDHSLEVARAAVGELVRPGFRVSEDPAANYREQPIWAYAGFVLALLHDVGKALEVEVKSPDGREAWDPLKGPLASFLEWSGTRTTGPALREWKAGRGSNAHVWKGRALFPIILSEKPLTFLGARLPELLDVFVRSYREGSEDWHRGPEGRIVEVVRRWDRKIAKGDDSAETTPHSRSVRERVGSRKEDALETEATEHPHDAKTEVQKAASEPPVEAAFPKAPIIPFDSPSASRPATKKAEQAEKPSGPTQKASEDEHRILVELDPARLLQTIQGWVRAGSVNAGRNCPSAQLFVTPKYLWLRYPEAFANILRGVGIHWSGRVGNLLLCALSKLPQIDGLGSGNPIVPAFPTPKTPNPAFFIRIKAFGFLPEAELALLGQWPFEMKVPPAVLAKPLAEPDPRARGEKRE